MAGTHYLIGVDTGGTYTDAAVLDAASHKVLASAKALTTRGDLSIGVCEAIEQAWQALPVEGQSPVLFTQLMQQHYDPLYERSLRSSYPQLVDAQRLPLADAEPATLRDAATRLLR